MNQDILEKIRSFSTYKKGWKFGRGEGISDKVINIAIEIVNLAMPKKFTIDAFPGVNGDIVVVVYGDAVDVSFEVQDDLSIIISTETGSDVLIDNETRINIIQIKWLLEKLRVDFSFEELEDCCYNEFIRNVVEE